MQYRPRQQRLVSIQAAEFDRKHLDPSAGTECLRAEKITLTIGSSVVDEPIRYSVLPASPVAASPRWTTAWSIGRCRGVPQASVRAG